MTGGPRGHSRRAAIVAHRQIPLMLMHPAAQAVCQWTQHAMLKGGQTQRSAAPMERTAAPGTCTSIHPSLKRGQACALSPSLVAERRDGEQQILGTPVMAMGRQTCAHHVSATAGQNVCVRAPWSRADHAVHLAASDRSARQCCDATRALSRAPRGEPSGQSGSGLDSETKFSRLAILQGGRNLKPLANDESDVPMPERTDLDAWAETWTSPVDEQEDGCPHVSLGQEDRPSCTGS